MVVAKNEYYLRTSGIRRLRPYFPYFVMGPLTVYVAIIAPALVNVLVDDFLAFILSQVAVAVVEIVLFLLFIYIMIVPITETLREMKTSQMELLLKAPIKPSDILLGEFLGVTPFYAIAVVVIAGFFTALLQPLGLNIIQIAIIVMVFVVTFLSALWIGTVIAALLRTQFGKIARGRDLGRGLSVVLVLPLIAVIYAIIGGGLLETLADPDTGSTINAILGFLPSSWGAEIIVSFASNPDNIGTIGFETLIQFGGLLTFFVAVLWLGQKVAGRAISIEPATFMASRTKPDGFFYNAVRYLGGNGSFGTLLASMFKDYTRRFENVSWLIYAVGLTAMVSLFFGDPSSGPREPLLIMSLLMSPLLSGLVAGTVSRGKEQLFIYKKSPSGIGRFVMARLFQGWFVAVPIAAVAMAVSTLLVPEITSVSLLTNVALGSLRTVAILALLLGLGFLIPNFSEESRARTLSIMINLQIVVFGTIGLEIGLPRLGLSFRRLFPALDSVVGLLYDHMLQTAIISLLGVTVLYLGKRKLGKIE